MSASIRTAPAGAFQSQLSPGLPRFLAHVVENALQLGLRTPQDFLRSFPPRAIMRALATEPERRGRILEATTGLRSRIASKKSPESSAEDLQIALDEGITTAATVVAQLLPDDRVRFLDAQQLWGFVTEPGYVDGGSSRGAEHNERVPEIREHTAYIIEQGLEEGLIAHRDVVSAISVPTLVDRLPRAELATVFERVLEEGRGGMAFTDELLFQLVPMPVIVTHVSLATLWRWLITAKIAVPLGLVADPAEGPPPLLTEEDDALFDEREAHPDASGDVTVIIDADGLATPDDGPPTVRPLAGRSA